MTPTIEDLEQASGEKVGDRSKEEDDDDLLLVEPYPRTQNSCSAPATWTPASMRNKLKHGDRKIVSKALQVNEEKAVSLWSYRSKRSKDQSKAS